MKEKIEFGDRVIYNGRACQVLAVGFIGECHTPLCLLQDEGTRKYYSDRQGNILAISVNALTKIEMGVKYENKSRW